MCVCSVNK